MQHIKCKGQHKTTKPKHKPREILGRGQLDMQYPYGPLVQIRSVLREIL